MVDEQFSSSDFPSSTQCQARSPHSGTRQTRTRWYGHELPRYDHIQYTDIFIRWILVVIIKDIILLSDSNIQHLLLFHTDLLKTYIIHEWRYEKLRTILDACNGLLQVKLKFSRPCTLASLMQHSRILRNTFSSCIFFHPVKFSKKECKEVVDPCIVRCGTAPAIHTRHEAYRSWPIFIKQQDARRHLLDHVDT
jgi:hypothetical protein